MLLPVGTSADIGAELRQQGWITVAALEAGAEAKALNCSHIFADGAVRPA